LAIKALRAIIDIMKTNKTTYKEKLNSPKWQKLRLEKMQQSNFSCELCGDDESQLHIHHIQYIAGFDPWMYGLHELQCLCDSCHTLTHLDKRKIDNYAQKELGLVVRKTANHYTGLLSKMEGRMIKAKFRKTNPDLWQEYRDLRSFLCDKIIELKSIARERESKILEKAHDKLEGQTRQRDGILGKTR